MAAAQIRIATLVVILAAWELVARSGLLYQDVVPSLFEIGTAFFQMFFDKETYWHFGVTAWEVGAGLAIGYVLGVAFGFVAGTRRFFGATVAPYVDGIATAPKIVFLPIVMLLVGTGIASKLALGALSAFFPVAINTAAGVRQVNPVLVRVGRSLRLSRWQMATRIYLPALRPSLVTSLRLGFGLAVVGVLLAEIKLSSAGLGFLANEHYSHYRVADLYAVLLLIFIIAVGLNGLMGRFAERR
ncbi:MAG TPA: ABC transporter permease [Burkholderiales bacterium]|nr:ABC transporter permease [Burkholderiales bacterium]